MTVKQTSNGHTKKGNPHFKIMHVLKGMLQDGHILMEGKKVNPLRESAFCTLAQMCEENGGTHPYFELEVRRTTIHENVRENHLDADGPVIFAEIRNSQGPDLDRLTLLKRKHSSKYPKTFERLGVVA